jgi:transcription elongation factor Elf1
LYVCTKLVQAMSKSPIPPIHQPRCPKCNDRMMLIRLVPYGEGSDVQTFECARCGETMIVETKDLSKEVGRRSGSRDLQSPQ